MKTKELVESHLKDLLKTMKGYKFIETLEVTFKKKSLFQRLERVNSYTKQHSSKENKGSILPPLQFRDDEEPTSITDRSSSKIKELSRALKGHAKSYEVEIQDNLNPLNHFMKTKELVESHLKDLLKTMKGYKFIETLEVTFKKKSLFQRLERVNSYTKQHSSKENKGSILPPLQFRDDEEPTSITDRSSSKIKELSRALKGHAKSYEVEIQDNLNPLNHFMKTKELVESHLKDLLKTMKGYKFIETLEVTFKKKSLIQRLERVNSYTKQHSSMVKLRPLLRLAK